MFNRREFVKSVAAAAAGIGVAGRFTYDALAQGAAGGRRQIFRDDGLRHMIAEMGIGQIVYGTDMPFPWPINPDTILNNRLLNNTEKEAILGGNLVKLLRLSPNATA